MLDDLAEALLTDGFGILERSGDGTRLEEAVQSALAAPEALKRAEAEAPEDTKERREMPCDESPEGTMVETGEDWIDLPDETPEAVASSLASGDVDPLEQTAKRLALTYEALMQGAADGIAVGPAVAQVKREHPAFATRN